MLQWMGGSRRKVTTSRKSSHKRQKQYFEQRKRQQQQQSASSENHANGKLLCSQQWQYNRSLDILSLANVSTVAQEQNTSSHNARYNSDEDDFSLNRQSAHPPPVTVTNVGIPVDQSELNDERTSPSYQKGDEYSKKVSMCLPDHIEDFVGNSDKLDHVNLSNVHNISVIDLLGDGGTNSNTVENSVHSQEAHVAFSVEGLGEVETETPVHSPEIPYRSSSPRKARRRPMGFKNLDYGFDDLGARLDVMMEGIDFSPYEDSVKEPLLSRGMMDVVGPPNQKFLNFRKSSPFNWKGSPLYGDCGNDALSYSIRESGSSIWNGPSFLDDNIGDLGEYKPFCKNWVEESNVGYYDYLHSKYLWEQDFYFGDQKLQKKRSSTKRTENFETPDPYRKHQIVNDLPDVIISDTKWYSTVGLDKDAKDAVNRFVREDTRESLSRLSEESCSSTAVWGDATKKSGENGT